MNNLEDYYRKYWNDIIGMSKKYNIEPWKFVRIRDKLSCKIDLTDHPDFNAFVKNGCKVEFFMAIIDNHPVFKNDIVYNSVGAKFVVFDKFHCNNGDVIRCFICGDCSKRFDFFVNDLYINNPNNTSSVQFTKEELEYIRYKINLNTKNDLALECVIQEKIAKQIDKL